MLDTWFSSALWPFATLGWPDETPELEAFYPGTLNTTAREIIRLWENRMIFSGLELMGEVPFRDVIIHSTVLARDGRRMSKSLGTGLDPLELDRPARRRRDALRAAEDVVDAGRPLLGRRGRGGPQAREQALERRAPAPRERRRRRRPSCGRATLEERWILARLDAPSAQVERRTSPRSTSPPATSVLYHVTFDDFCDWYAEAIKPRLYDGDEDAQATALATSSGC